MQKNSKLWHELRALWNWFDPIGVHKLCNQLDLEAPDDEYDDYIDPILNILRSKPYGKKLYDYVVYIVSDYMGVQCNHKRLLEFILKIEEMSKADKAFPK